MSKLTIVPPQAEKLDSEPKIEVGQWYWVKSSRKEDWERPGFWLGCVTHIGSNYVRMTSIEEGSTRMHLDDFDCELALDAEDFIKRKIAEHQGNVKNLLDEVQRVTASLGIVQRSALADASRVESQALAAAHGSADIKAHKQALITAKKETLPGLFKKIEEQHEKLARWMKAQLVPMKAELHGFEKATEAIEDRIFTVELYAGLVETITQIVDGAPAPNDAKVHLFQRRHYMDEECLVRYTAGGMEFEDLKAFDKWLAKKDNLDRILPFPRCIVAFRVRRREKDRDWDGQYSLHDFIRMQFAAEADKKTFLYIRNGERVYRLDTEIEFDEQLFPDREHSILFASQTEDLWLRKEMSGIKNLVTQGQYEHIMKERADDLAEYESNLAESKKLPKKERYAKFGYLSPPHYWDTYEKFDKSSVWYDDGLKLIGKATKDHNRIAVVLQGLLDRSEVLHPHPPWRIWTPEGFAAGIELVYDDSRAIASGPPPDFEAYRLRLNESLRRGSYTIGQQDLWLLSEQAKEQARRDRSWRNTKDVSRYWSPYGNDGPGCVAKVIRIGRDGRCHYTWERDRQKIRWVNDPSSPGYMKADESTITTHFSCSSEKLFNASAYKKGDYRIFYDDPRTRADYLKWTKYLLAAEDFVCGKTKK